MRKKAISIELFQQYYNHFGSEIDLNKTDLSYDCVKSLKHKAKGMCNLGMSPNFVQKLPRYDFDYMYKIHMQLGKYSVLDLAMLANVPTKRNTA